MTFTIRKQSDKLAEPMATTIQKALDVLDELSLQDRQYVLEVEKQRIVDERRTAIKTASDEAIADHKAGKLKSYDNVTDLMKALRE